MNQPPFKLAPMAGRLNFPGHSLTLIVKGTFNLSPGKVVTIADEQILPTGDEFYPDDEEKQGSVQYESDFAWHKPKSDLLLVGKCHPAGGRSVPRCPVTFRVGNKSKTLAVLGNRRWEKHWLSWKATEPEAFNSLTLRYENSFGGAKFPANPLGKGFAEIPDGSGGKYCPLPNIEDPAHLIESHGQRPAPAGFGPQSRTWAVRRAKLGTYDSVYLKTRWPWLPKDVDWTHFNAAPPDMQLDGFLRGDEQLSFENLHPKHARYESQLPGLRVRCFVYRLTGASSGEHRFEEVTMNLDTLWVDMEAEKLVLVWRGWTAVASEDFEEEIKDFLAISEPLSQSPADVQSCYREYLTLKAAKEEPFEPEAPPASPPKPGAVPEPSTAAGKQQKEAAELAAKIQAQTNAFYAQMGIDVNKLPPGHKEKQAGLIAHLAENDPKKTGAAEGKMMASELKQAFAKLGLDADHLPPASAKAKAEQARFAKEMGFDEADLKRDPNAEMYASLTAALLPKLGHDPENLDSLIEDARKLKLESKQAEAAKPAAEAAAKAGPKPIDPAALPQRIAKGEDLEGADLHGLDLSGLDLKGANFAGANLSGARLCKTKLQNANLTKANLRGANLTEADLTSATAPEADFSDAKLCQASLKSADLTGAKLGKADLSKAILDEAILEASDLTEALLAGSSAVKTHFNRANLTGANFTKGAGVQADFSKATLARANFQEANLTEASVISAAGNQINLTGANLAKLRGSGCDFTGAKMIEADGNGSVWKNANLTGADLRYAHMEDAMFTAACLKQANLTAADLKFSRLNKANLTQAKMVKMNLFQGNLEKANLTEADCSGANLYEVDFLNAITDRTVMEGTNLLMTKLEPV